MAFLALLIGAVLIVAALRNRHGDLAGALKQDVPSFAVWGAAVFGVALVGFIPGLKPVSRGLLALLVVVLILTNYENIIGSFQGLSRPSPSGVDEDPNGAPGPLTNVGNGGGAMKSWDFLGSIGGGMFDFSDLLALGTSPAGPTSPTPPADVAPVQSQSSAARASGLFQAAASQSEAPQSAAPKMPGVSAITAADPLGTAAARQWQVDTFAYEASKLKASGLDPNSAAYQSKLSYIANLRGGVAGQSQGFSDLKAMGL